MTITLPDDLADLVRQEAERQHTSVADLVCRIVETSLPTAEPRTIPLAGLVDDPELTPATKLEEALSRDWPDAIDRDR